MQPPASGGFGSHLPPVGTFHGSSHSVPSGPTTPPVGLAPNTITPPPAFPSVHPVNHVPGSFVPPPTREHTHQHPNPPHTSPFGNPPPAPFPTRAEPPPSFHTPIPPNQQPPQPIQSPQPPPPSTISAPPPQVAKASPAPAAAVPVNTNADVRYVIDTFNKALSSPPSREKPKWDDMAKRIPVLISVLEKGEGKPEAVQLLVAICKAAETGDHANASKFLQDLTVLNQLQGKELVGVKRFLEVAKIR